MRSSGHSSPRNRAALNTAFMFPAQPFCAVSFPHKRPGRLLLGQPHGILRASGRTHFRGHGHLRGHLLTGTDACRHGDGVCHPRDLSVVCGLTRRNLAERCPNTGRRAGFQGRAMARPWNPAPLNNHLLLVQSILCLRKQNPYPLSRQRRGGIGIISAIEPQRSHVWLRNRQEVCHGLGCS